MLLTYYTQIIKYIIRLYLFKTYSQFENIENTFLYFVINIFKDKYINYII